MEQKLLVKCYYEDREEKKKSINAGGWLDFVFCFLFVGSVSLFSLLSFEWHKVWCWCAPRRIDFRIENYLFVHKIHFMSVCIIIKQKQKRNKNS